jgi:hypothetical protein
MRVISTLFLVLAIFALGAGATLGLWGHEVAGTLYLMVLGVAFTYLAHVTRLAGDEPAESEEGASSILHERAHGSETETRSGAAPEVPVAKAMTFHASAPSLTPLFFALAAGLLVTGLVFTQWLVIFGGLVLALVAIVWFIETGRRRAAEEAAKAGGGGHHAP